MNLALFQFKNIYLSHQVFGLKIQNRKAVDEIQD